MSRNCPAAVIATTCISTNAYDEVKDDFMSFLQL